MPPYVTAQELENALGTATYVGIFADSGTDIINATAVALILRAAHADVRRFAFRGYDGAVEDPVPDEVWALELDFAKARSLMRGDAYARDAGERLFKDATKTAEAVAAGLQRTSTTMPNPSPALSPEPPPVPGGSGATPVDFTGSSLPWEQFWDPIRRC
jgi:hypothetical protein